ncbi:MAG TPA: HAD domain-containing protein [Kofleriaceae bacterium]|nr:HAD domain-containing protein [Kofleriaceae bacterium]
MPVVFLDVDGVLNRVGYCPERSEGLRDWIEPDLAQQLDRAVRDIDGQLVLSSDWRRGRELEVLREELRAAGIEAPLIDVTPVLETARWQEIIAWCDARHCSLGQIAVIDDRMDMGPLAQRFVRTSPLCGFDAAAAAALRALFGEGPDASCVPGVPGAR